MELLPSNMEIIADGITIVPNQDYEADGIKITSNKDYNVNYLEGDYVEGDYVEGDNVEGDYVEGDYVEGDYVEGDYEGVYGGDSSPEKTSTTSDSGPEKPTKTTTLKTVTENQDIKPDGGSEKPTKTTVLKTVIGSQDKRDDSPENPTTITTLKSVTENQDIKPDGGFEKPTTTTVLKTVIENQDVKSDEGPEKPTTTTLKSVMENRDIKSKGSDKSIQENFPEISDNDPMKRATTVKSGKVLNRVDSTSSGKSNKRGTFKGAPEIRNSSHKTVAPTTTRTSASKLRLETVNAPPKDIPTEKRLGFRSITFIEDIKSCNTIEDHSAMSYKSNSTKLHTISVLSSDSEFIYGARPSDSDLCSECLIIEHHRSFEKNILKNIYGSTDEPHTCRMVSVQKRGPGKYMQVCSDSDCPKFRFWKIVDAGGAGWKSDASSPPPEPQATSCFITSDGLCSKEQLVELSQVGLSPRIMDEVRPDIEVSEWFSGRGGATSRYGFKVSLLDGQQLMMCVYGECRTLHPADGQGWRKVTFTFRDYEPGVRYVLFHHGGTGQTTQGEAHPGSRMTGASVVARLPRGPPI